MIDEMAIQDWIERRFAFNRAERKESLQMGDQMSVANTVGAMLELHDLRSWLIAQGTEAQRAETENTGSVHDGLVPKECAQPTDVSKGI